MHKDVQNSTCFWCQLEQGNAVIALDCLVQGGSRLKGAPWTHQGFLDDPFRLL